jgi:4-alpha-glucanotransferase
VQVPILAEDLGVITTDVNELRELIGAPGMVVLQFAWGSDAANCHLPHNHYPNRCGGRGGWAAACTPALPPNTTTTT